MRHYNEKPSQHSNIGQDVSGAARHHRDTYETPEELRAKAFKKSSTKALKDLKAEYTKLLASAVSESTEAGIKVIKTYEFKYAIEKCDLFTSFKGSPEYQAEDVYALKSIVLAETDPAKREIMRKAFNRMTSKMHRARYMNPRKVSSYFESKKRESFVEHNGRKANWSLASAVDISAVKQSIASRVRAVQFGNSVPDSEREYCLANLNEALLILEKRFKVDTQSLAFSFGARGKAGSVAHYQDSAKVLQFNRHIDGAFAHELGHAIDYALGLVSKQMPYSIRSKYQDKIREVANVLPIDPSYYCKSVEIFARLFEQWIRVVEPSVNEWMQYTYNPLVMPELDTEAMEWMNQVLKPVLK